MELRKALQNFAKVAADEAERNPEFEQRIRKALGLSEAVVVSSSQVATRAGKAGCPSARWPAYARRTQPG